MRRVIDIEFKVIQPFFEVAGEIARKASCHRAKCGAIIVKDSEIIGKGYNGPAMNDEANRTCDNQYDLTIKPKYDKTCCIHAEWRAILDACKHNADKIDGSILYFMRVNEDGNFTDAGYPYCTTCSRLTLESGVGEFALWNDNGADIYNAVEYNRKSYDYFSIV